MTREGDPDVIGKPGPYSKQSICSHPHPLNPPDTYVTTLLPTQTTKSCPGRRLTPENLPVPAPYRVITAYNRSGAAHVTSTRAPCPEQACPVHQSTPPVHRHSPHHPTAAPPFRPPEGNSSQWLRQIHLQSPPIHHPRAAANGLHFMIPAK